MLNQIMEPLLSANKSQPIFIESRQMCPFMDIDEQAIFEHIFT